METNLEIIQKVSMMLLKGNICYEVENKSIYEY